MSSFLGIISDVIRLLTFQPGQERIRNDLPRREGQVFEPDVRPHRDPQPRYEYID